MTAARRIAIAAAALSLLGACSDSSGTTDNAGSTPSTNDADGTGNGDGTSTVTSTTDSADRTTTSGAGSSTVPRTSVSGTVPPTTIAAPVTTDPFAPEPEPDVTEPDDLPGPPIEGCIDAAAGPPSVEIAFNDDIVLYAGVEAPPCVRIHGAQQLTVRSASGVAANVVIGADSYPVAAGASVSTAQLGTLYAVGDAFDVYVEELDTTVVVQVLP